MKVLSVRGRLLLHVTDARRVQRDKYGASEVFYSYTGEGCGGYGPRSMILNTIDAILADAPRARIIGDFPNV
jgi:hypothetical protein